MAISCGFYNSVNHDRVYDAVQFGEMFDGLITDGVYATVGNRMMVTTVSGMTIRVRSGRAWFNKTWTVNTGDYPLDIPAADVLLPRIDAVILEVDTRLQTRNNSLKIISGRSASNPSKPTLTRANGLYQYPLAWVTVPANARSITSANIEIQVGRDPTPFVTGVVNQTSISDLWNKWDKEFQDWFDEVRDTLNGSGGNLTALTSRVSSLETKMSTVEGKVGNIPSKATDADVEIGNLYNGGGDNTRYITTKTLGYAIQKHIWVSGSPQSYNINYLVNGANLLNWFGNFTDNNGASSTVADILNGTKINSFISPYSLKQAFPKLYSSDGSSGSGQSDFSIIPASSLYTVRSSMSIDIGYSSIWLFKYGNIATITFHISGTVGDQNNSLAIWSSYFPTPKFSGEQEGVINIGIGYQKVSTDSPLCVCLEYIRNGGNYCISIDSLKTGINTAHGTITYVTA